jgi:hypothetical protein
MGTRPVYTIVPAHRFIEADRGTDSADGEEGLCVYRNADDYFCDHAASHSVHHGVDEPRYEREDAQ